MAAPREIPQRELRNRISEVLREVEAGAELRITVHGRPVADLVPIRERRTFVPFGEITRALAELPVDPGFASDIADAIGDDEARDPWEGEHG
jgi:prevent-host-death family protein